MSAFFASKRTVQPIVLSDIEISNPENPRFSTDISELKESITRVGMLQPVMLSPSMKLISGKRRFQAAKELGLNEIPAIILSLSGPLEELAALDENLVRLPLNSVEFDEAIYRRKMIYEEQFPETRQGTAGALQTETPAFTEETAGKLDVSRRTVELAVARAKNASAKVKEARAAGTLSSSKVNELVTLEPSLQDEILPLIENKSVTEVREIVNRVKSSGVEKTLSEMSAAMPSAPAENLFRDLQRVQRDLSTLLSTDAETMLGIQPRDPVVKQTKGVMRMMRAFLGRVKVEAEHAALSSSREVVTHAPDQSAL